MQIEQSSDLVQGFKYALTSCPKNKKVFKLKVNISNAEPKRSALFELKDEEAKMGLSIGSQDVSDFFRIKKDTKDE